MKRETWHEKLFLYSNPMRCELSEDDIILLSGEEKPTQDQILTSVTTEQTH